MEIRPKTDARVGKKQGVVKMMVFDDTLPKVRRCYPLCFISLLNTDLEHTRRLMHPDWYEYLRVLTSLFRMLHFMAIIYRIFWQ